ncbi:MAG: DUF616 domain-containing protein [Alphaproteobacteria bacterium]|nr:DUF616 domain-containing protein [Alphaproteobacteria bacterium]
MKRAIYTVIVDGYDRLIEPQAFAGWDYICFTDGKRAGLKARMGLSKWQIRTLDPEGLDSWRHSRLPKILPHRFLADYDYSVYIDGNARLLTDPAKLLDGLGWPDMAVSEHPFRDTVFEEIAECIAQNKAPRHLLERQREAYRAAGLPDDTALLENNFLLRRHNAPQVIALMEAWWEQLNTHSHRDQLSLPFVAWKLGFDIRTFGQDLKRTVFATKAHYRSPWARWKRSLKKRMGKLA